MSPAPALALCALLVGCGPRAVEGSLSTQLDLDYSTAEVTTSPDLVALSFTTPQGEGKNIVLQVSARLTKLTLAPNVPVNLAEVISGTTQRGTVARNVLQDPRTSFPRLERGQLTLSALPQSGKKVRGAFSVTFVEGTTYANGRTAFATFEANVP